MAGVWYSLIIKNLADYSLSFKILLIHERNFAIR